MTTTTRKSNMDRIREGLEAINSAFVGSSSKVYDYKDGKSYYAIHPDHNYPHQKNIKRFSSQREILSWIRAVKRANILNRGLPVEGRLYMATTDGDGQWYASLS